MIILKARYWPILLRWKPSDGSLPFFYPFLYTCPVQFWSTGFIILISHRPSHWQSNFLFIIPPIPASPNRQNGCLFHAVYLSFQSHVFSSTIFLNRYLVVLKRLTQNIVFYVSLISLASIMILVTFGGLVASNPFAGSIQNLHDKESLTNLDFTFSTPLFITIILLTWYFSQWSSLVSCIPSG